MKLYPGFCVSCARVNAHTADCPSLQKIRQEERIAKLEADVKRLTKIIMDNSHKLDIRY